MIRPAPTPRTSSEYPSIRARAWEVLVYFFRLGCFGFGGPLAIVASIQKDLIETRQWVSPEEFAQVFPLIKAMPGPIAFQTAVYIGRLRAGFWGACAAGFGIVFPAFVMMIVFGAALESVGDLPALEPVLAGMQAAALGLIMASLKGLFWGHRKSRLFWIMVVVAIAITAAAPASEPLVILGCGAFITALFEIKKRSSSGPMSRLKFSWMFPFFSAGGGSALATIKWPMLGDLTWACFKAGALVFGSGIAIVPLMEQDFVVKLKWLTHAEFMNALAFGQITPGPVVITATYIGYKTLGIIGACLATASIFAAPFFHMTTWFPRLVGKLSRLEWISPFLLGAIGGVVGSIVSAGVRLAIPFSTSPTLMLLLIGTFAAASFTSLPAWSLIPVAGLLSWLGNLLKFS
jgi:chromate transporter